MAPRIEDNSSLKSNKNTKLDKDTKLNKKMVKLLKSSYEDKLFELENKLRKEAPPENRKSDIHFSSLPIAIPDDLDIKKNNSDVEKVNLNSTISELDKKKDKD